MNRGNWTNAIGFGLLAICFIIAVGRVMTRAKREASDTVTLRIAHWQLESGLRDAFEAVGRAYMEEHPGVVVEQLAVPERVFKSWLRTQLVGGTAPDLIEIGQGIDFTTLGRNFIPLGEELELPNPYNVGTDLENRPWRRTFTDGLSSAFNDSLLDYYGVPTSLFTVRVFYNKTLWNDIFGNRPPPSTYEEFIAACEEATEYGRRTGRTLVPISSSRYHTRFLTERLFQSQTQRFVQRLDHGRTLMPLALDVGVAYLRGEWDYREPAMRDGFQLIREVGLHMQPGFSQLAREDGTFYFVQGHALMTSSGSWDSSTLRIQAPFEVGVFPVPLPTVEHPRYGPNVIGEASEAGTDSGALFGVTRGSKHPEQALDFLKFLTSRRGNELFMKQSGWLPVIVGVEPDDEDMQVRPFMPILEGAVPGITQTMRDLGTELSRLLQDQFHRLVGPTGGVDDYLAAIEPRVAQHVRADFTRRAQRSRWNLWRHDVNAAAHMRLDELTADRSSAVRWRLALEGQSQQEADMLWITRVLEETRDGPAPRPASPPEKSHVSARVAPPAATAAATVP